MTDLERFFYRLVQTLSATDPARLRQPIPLAELRGSIIPYRTNRRVLELDTSEDYELVLMRLCVGEGAFAYLSPEEARVRFEQELASPNPQLEVLRQFGDALVSLVPSRVAAAVAAAAAAAAREAPAEMLDSLLPAPETAPETDAEVTMPWPVVEGVGELAALARAAVHCLACGETLPGDRLVKFCPYCGKSQVPARCSACDAELEPSWRFCAVCGHAAGGQRA